MDFNIICGDPLITFRSVVYGEAYVSATILCVNHNNVYVTYTRDEYITFFCEF